MSDTCPTVKVASDHPAHAGYIVINESDFDETVHERYVEESEGDEDAPERETLVAEIVALGGEKPHHKTGVAKLEEILAALKAEK